MIMSKDSESGLLSIIKPAKITEAIIPLTEAIIFLNIWLLTIEDNPHKINIMGHISVVTVKYDMIPKLCSKNKVPVEIRKKL